MAPWRARAADSLAGPSTDLAPAAAAIAASASSAAPPALANLGVS